MSLRKHVAFVEGSDTGAGDAAVEYALGQGYAVTMFTRTPERWRGPYRVIECETNDLARLLAAVEEVGREERIDGLTTTADLHVLNASLACEVTGLPGPHPAAVARAVDKHSMRCALADAGCDGLNPAFAKVEGPDWEVDLPAGLGFPLIAKPVDANDSWNVRRISSARELSDYCQEAAAWSLNSAGQPLARRFLLEELVEGPEYSVELASGANGDVTVLTVIEKSQERGSSHYFPDAGAALPIGGAVADRLSTAARQALAALELRCGVFHVECRVARSGVKIIEVNPRLIGDMLGSHVIELALGDSPVRLVVEIALGEAPSWRPKLSRGAASCGIPMPASGTFLGIENLAELETLPGVAIARATAPRGSRRLAPPRTNADYVGRVVAVAESPREAKALAASAARKAMVATDLRPQPLGVES